MIYQIMMIDPPWPKKKGGKRAVRPMQGRELEYKTIPITEIFQLLDAEIFPLLDQDSSVFMWTIDEFLIEAEAQMLQRGFRRHARLIWDKQNGVAPAFSVRFSHEYLLWFYRGKFRPIAKSERGKWTTVQSEQSERHSQKPDVWYRAIDQWFPTDRRLDVFARRVVPGWDGWGDQYVGEAAQGAVLAAVEFREQT